MKGMKVNTSYMQKFRLEETEIEEVRDIEGEVGQRECGEGQ